MESVSYLEHQKNFNKISGKKKSKIDLSLPSQEEIDECTQRTRLQIEELLHKLNGPSDITPKETYVRYTPSSSVLNNATAKQRIIKIVDKQVDPMLPPKFKNNQKTPALPDQLMAETAILRGTNRSDSNNPSLSKEERQRWNIPAAVSNWKNQKGFAIAIDKRLASGGGYISGVDHAENEERMINKKFSVLAQSLHSADLKAREDIRARHRLKVKQAQQKKLEAEKKLQDLALQANETRNMRKRFIKDEDHESKSDEQRISDRKQRLADYEKKMKRSKLSEDQKILSLTNNDQRIAIGLSRNSNNQSDSGKPSGNMDPDSNDIFVGTAPRFVSSSTNSLYDAPLFNQHEAISNIYTTKNSGNNTSNRMISTIKSFKGGVSADGEKSGAVRFTKETSLSTSSGTTQGISNSNDAGYGLSTSKNIEAKSRWDDDDDDDDE